MRCYCPHCSHRVVQARNLDGPNFCEHCKKLFFPPIPEKIPPWVLGVLVILMANWQILYHFSIA